ncbi:S-adenosyl-L-methionine-dependent methyltransferase [Umbelopsis sp. PMI_123]|nr:S-adenosyl-L-methionine-dependent methyltransferase [Umbelopsis sp. PMI_123]
MSEPNTTKDSTDWEKRWQDGNTPWDHGESSPALGQLLNEQANSIPTQGNVLVPGCGQGYDVFLLASPERKVYGLDLSETCIQKCQKLQQEKQLSDTLVTFLCEDFFTFDVPAGKFSLIYDYTFFCALPPALRAQWGQRMADIIPIGGVLVCLIFPLDEHKGGPPFSVTVDAYKAALNSSFENIYLADCKGHASRVGKEKISIWKRQ